MYLPTNFNSGISLELAELIDEAYVMYKAASNNQSWNYPAGYTGIAEFDAHAAAVAEDKRLGFIVKKGNNLYVVFRGTSNMAEWVSDVEASQASFIPGWGKIHVGFRDIFNSCKDNILSSVQASLKDDITDIYITGHSLGGAVASICLPYLKSNLKANVIFHLFTFSSPRAGDKDFANGYIADPAIEKWRVFNTEDIVPTVPCAVSPLPFSGQYEHVGSPIAYSVQTGSLTDNHSLDRYTDLLNAKYSLN